MAGRDPQPSADPGALAHHYDHALCAPVAGSSGVGITLLTSLQQIGYGVCAWLACMYAINDCIGFAEVDMASITIRNLDDDLKAQLRIVAASHGRSMEEEARTILRQALARQEKRGGLGSRIHSRFAAVGGVDLALPERKDKARAASFDE